MLFNKPIAFFASFVLILALIVIFGIYQGAKLEINHIHIDSQRVPEALKGKRIALLTDLHGHMTEDHRQKLIASLKETAPVAILLSGDMVDSSSQYWEDARALMEVLPEIAPTYYSFGNHEISNIERGADLDWLNDLDITILRNERIAFEIGGESIAISGLDDRLGFSSQRDYILNLAQLKSPSDYQILLSHRPEFAVDYAEAGYDLVVSGHAHGGQIRVSLFGAIYSPHQGFFPKFTEGLHSLGDTRLVISRGLGNNAPFPRLFNPTELVLLNFE